MRHVTEQMGQGDTITLDDILDTHRLLMAHRAASQFVVLFAHAITEIAGRMETLEHETAAIQQRWHASVPRLKFVL